MSLTLAAIAHNLKGRLLPPNTISPGAVTGDDCYEIHPERPASWDLITLHHREMRPIVRLALNDAGDGVVAQCGPTTRTYLLACPDSLEQLTDFLAAAGLPITRSRS